jgi:hypothetical protein
VNSGRFQKGLIILLRAKIFVIFVFLNYFNTLYVRVDGYFGVRRRVRWLLPFVQGKEKGDLEIFAHFCIFIYLFIFRIIKFQIYY